VSEVHRCAEPGEVFPDWSVVFGARASELHVECGSGKGLFAREFAARHPEVALIAIETRRVFVESTRAKAARAGVTNLHVLQGDARQLLPRCFRPGEVAEIHVHCPDPWWKRRHWKRRLVDVDFTAAILAVLRPGGRVDFRTDVRAYADEAARSFADAGFRPEPQPLPEVLSNRERGYENKGRPVYRFFMFTPGAAAARAPTQRTGRDWTDVRRR
jgi:tRNA (guanine-N7-)-methyltransferase